MLEASLGDVVAAVQIPKKRELKVLITYGIHNGSGAAVQIPKKRELKVSMSSGDSKWNLKLQSKSLRKGN